MYALTSRAYGKLQTNFGYQGKEMQNAEFYDGTGLEAYDFEARYYDPQLGRWHNQDPAGQFASPYNAMGNKFTIGRDPDGRFAWFVPVIIGAVVGAYSGASMESGNWNFTQWNNDWWKGAIVGGLVGAAAGAGVSYAFGAAGTLSGSVSSGWQMVSSGLVNANISMGSKWMQGGGLDDIWKSGAIGFGSGVIGQWAQLKFADKISLPNKGWISDMLPSDVFEKGLGNMVSGALYGAADRAITSSKNGIKGGDLLLHTLLGSIEGGIAGFATGGSDDYGILDIPYLRTLGSSAITSVPGLGLRTGKLILTIAGLAGAREIDYSGASELLKLFGYTGLLGGEVGLHSFNITKWLKRIRYPDPFPIKWL
jgi:RHS repeat-associated protein